METVKKIFGFLLLATALYVLIPFLGIEIFSTSLMAMGILALAYFSFLDKNLRHSKIVTVLRAATLIVAVIATGQLFSRGEKIATDKEWVPYRPGILEEARGNGQKVIIDFYADWCIPCQELTQFTFPDEVVRESLKDFVKVKVDLTFGGKEAEDALQRQFEVEGFPTIVFIGGDGKEVRNLRILGFVTASEMVEIVRGVR
jgi:thiol:disulfide interchange protein DsbD